MTQPDQYFPDTAINASPGFAAYAATTKEEYEQQLRDRTTNIFSGISGLCALLQELPFFGGLAQLGAGGDMGDLGQTGNILKGIQDFADAMCALIIPGSAGDTTPQTVIEGVNSTVETAQASTVYSQLMDLGGSSTGNILLDLLAGIEAFFSAVLGIFTGTGDVTDLLDVLEGIPILGDLVQWITGQQSTGTVSGDGNILTNFFQDILDLLGLDSGGDGDGGTTPGSGGFDLFGALISFLEGLLPAGLLTSIIEIPLNLFAGLVPGTSNNVLPTGDVGGALTTVQGQGLWVWDWPSSTGGVWGSGGCVRTVRPGVITIFWVTGVWEQLVGGSSVHLDIPGYGDIGDPRVRLQELMANVTVDEGYFEAYQAAGLTVVPKSIGDNLLDWDRFEVVWVPYSGALYPLGYSIEEGVQNLKSMIRQIPGKFILMGGSLGAAVTSQVFRDIVNPTGSLHNRNDDLLFGWSGASPMRAEGATWPGNPFPVSGHGCLYDNLVTDDPRWWEFSLPYAESYPAFGQLDGISWANEDPISALGDDALCQQVRALVDKSYSKKTITANDQTDFMVMLISESIFNATAANVLLGIGFNETASPHGLGWWTVQPFLDQGDTRTFWEYSLDHINNEFGPLVSPDIEGVQHQLEGIPQTVKPYQVVTASVPVMWCNVVCSGPAIMLAVNAYDANGTIIAGPQGQTPSVVATDATISNPTANSAWTTLEASFVMPAGAKTAHVVYSVEPAAMTSGTVWFDISSATFEVTDLIDASLLANLEQFPGIGAHQVGGVQGEANMLTAIQNLLDGIASANSQGNLTGVQLAELFASQGITAISAAEALTLAIQHQRELSVISNEAVYVGLSPTGEATFELQTLPEGTVMPHTSIAAGTAVGGFLTCKRAASKGFVEFLAQGPVGVSDVFLNVYELDQATGTLTLRWESGNIAAQIPQGYFGWVMLTIPEAEEVVVTAGEIVLIEIAAQTDSIDVVSRTSGIPDKNSIPPNFGTTRVLASTGGVSPASLDYSDETYRDTRPYICFGVENVPPPYHPPNDGNFPTPGYWTYSIPDYAQIQGYLVDVIALGGGGAGDIAWLWQPGMGGLPGEWQAQTFIYGTDIPLGTTTLEITVGDLGYANAGWGGTSSVGYANGPVPVFDAAGAGGWSSGTTNMVWQHNATAGAYVLVASHEATRVTYGGVDMEYLGLGAWGLANVDGGAKNVVARGDFGFGACGGSVSYTGVDSVGAVTDSPDWEAGQTLVVFCDSGGTERYYDVVNGYVMYIGDTNQPDYFTAVWAAIPLNGPDRGTLLRANGGAGAGGGDQMGVGAGTTTYNNRSYFGGGDTWGTAAAPGGGGAGAPGWGEWGNHGARGEVWLTVRQP